MTIGDFLTSNDRPESNAIITVLKKITHSAKPPFKSEGKNTMNL